MAGELQERLDKRLSKLGTSKTVVYNREDFADPQLAAARSADSGITFHRSGWTLACRGTSMVPTGGCTPPVGTPPVSCVTSASTAVTPPRHAPELTGSENETPRPTPRIGQVVTPPEQSDLEEMLAAAVAENRRLSLLLEETRQRSDKQHEELQKLGSQLSELQDLDRQRKQLETEVSAAKAERDQGRAEIAQLTSERVQLEGLVEKLRSESRELTEERSCQGDVMIEAESTAGSAAESSPTLLCQSLASFSRLSSQDPVDAAEWEERLRAVESERDSAQRDLQQAREKIAAEWEDRCRSVESERDAAKRDLEQAKAKADIQLTRAATEALARDLLQQQLEANNDHSTRLDSKSVALYDTTPSSEPETSGHTERIELEVADDSARCAAEELARELLQQQLDVVQLEKEDENPLSRDEVPQGVLHYSMELLQESLTCPATPELQRRVHKLEKARASDAAEREALAEQLERKMEDFKTEIARLEMEKAQEAHTEELGTTMQTNFGNMLDNWMGYLDDPVPATTEYKPLAHFAESGSPRLVPSGRSGTLSLTGWITNILGCGSRY